MATPEPSSVLTSTEALPDERFDEICNINFKNPTTTLICAFFALLAIDRFYLGQIGMGILKLLTFGFCMVGGILDIISAQKRTHAFNLRLLEMSI